MSTNNILLELADARAVSAPGALLCSDAATSSKVMHVSLRVTHCIFHSRSRSRSRAIEGHCTFNHFKIGDSLLHRYKNQTNKKYIQLNYD
eukprot:gene10744-7472_t